MATEILRPNAAGSYTNIPNQFPSSGSHWDKVDEAEADEYTTYLYTNYTTSMYKDAYNLEPTAIPTGSTINNVQVSFRGKAFSGNKEYQPFLRLGTNETIGMNKAPSGSEWETFNEILARPGGGEWAIDDLNSLQVAIGIRGNASVQADFTQVYVEVDYTAPPIEGSASGSGIGLATSSSLLKVLAQAQGNGIGLASSSAKLEVLASALGDGTGLSLASPYLIIPAFASGQGRGLGTSTTYLIIPISASASGIGLGSVIGEVLLPPIVSSGIGTATAQGILDVIGQAQGNGIGLATAQAILDILAEAGGSGVGLGSTEALIRVLATAAASGEGLGSAEALLEVIAEATGEGIGSGQSQSYIIVIDTSSGSGIGTALMRGGSAWFMKSRRIESHKIPLYSEARR